MRRRVAPPGVRVPSNAPTCRPPACVCRQMRRRVAPPACGSACAVKCADVRCVRVPRQMPSLPVCPL
eukprot:4196622-Prymnesium_polylepis.1